jgi:hypothetical protein
LSGLSEKNVFILLTPHSYLNACEVQFKLKLPEESTYLCFLTEHKESLRQIENIKDQGKIHWGKIQFLFGHKGRKIGKNRTTEILYLIRNFVCILFLNIRISRVNRLIVANILNPWMKYLVSKSGAKEIIILDDGNATIPILQENRHIEEQFRIPPELKARKNFLLSRLQGSPVMNNRLKFFTVFDAWDNNHTIIKISNDFGYMKQFSGSFERTPEVLVIGSPLVRFGLISLETFNKVLTSLKRIYDGHELIYVKHRTESDEYPGDFKYVSLNKPVELYLLENRILPFTIISFFSTAGINLHRIFGSQVHIVNLKIPECYITNTQYAHLVNTLTDYYRNQENDFFRTTEITIN